MDRGEKGEARRGGLIFFERPGIEFKLAFVIIDGLLYNTFLIAGFCHG
jgi:hypothetical protein